MNSSLTAKRSAVIAALALGILLAAWLVSRIDIKSEIVDATQRTTGFNVVINQEVSIRLFPRPHLVLNDVHLAAQGEELASVGRIAIGVDLLPLLRKQARINRISLRDVTLNLVRDRNGKLNVDVESTSPQSGGSLALTQISLENVSFRYLNQKRDKEFNAAGCSLDSDAIEFAGSPAEFIKAVAISAHGACKQMRNERFTGDDVAFRVAGDRGILKFEPLTMDILGGKGSGKLDADFNGETPVYQLHYSIAEMQLDDLFKSIAPSKAGAGVLQFDTDLTMRGVNAEQLTRTAVGHASLRGQDLELAISDLDEKLDKFESSQNFNLVDLGAFFIAGPFGAVATKGYDFAKVLQKDAGSTKVETFVSQWSVKNGIAQAQDVGMTTAKNRLIMTGALDFPNKQFQDVKVIVLDDESCARIEQRIHGSFAKPEIAKANILKSLTGPINRLVNKVKDLAGKKCTPVTGSAAEGR